MAHPAFRRVPRALGSVAVMLIAGFLLVACNDRPGAERPPTPGDAAVPVSSEPPS